jgi:hypothetical protein
MHRLIELKPSSVGMETTLGLSPALHACTDVEWSCLEDLAIIRAQELLGNKWAEMYGLFFPECFGRN